MAGQLVIGFSEDAYGAQPAKYTVTVNGVDLTPADNTVTTPHFSDGANGSIDGVVSGNSQYATFDVSGVPKNASGGYTVVVTFVNDATAGTLATDRNLFVDSVFLDGQPAASYSFGSGTTAYLTSAYLRHTNDSETTQFAACYARGTQIATPAGSTAIESLAIGDSVTTLDGPARVKWIGFRAYAGRIVSGNPAVMPVTFRAGSLAEGVPSADLAVSPRHAMFLDGVLVPAACLVNGATIVQARRMAQVEYWHVELDRHAVLIANGAPSESFVDCDSRQMFHNAASFHALYPDDASPRWAFCAERVEDGSRLAAIRTRIDARIDDTGVLSAA